MPIRCTLLISTILWGLTGALAAEPVLRELVVSASPYQAFGAFTSEWQLRQWTGAVAVHSDGRLGGAWRLTYADDRIDEGLYAEVERGQRVNFSLVRGSGMTDVRITFSALGTGTRIAIEHQVPGDDRAARKLRGEIEAWWDARLSGLKEYLTENPGGYVARPRAEGAAPPVLVLHDRFGLNRTVRAYCDSLAAVGYLALAPDMFRGDATSDLTQAAKFVELASADDAEAAAARGLAHLRMLTGKETARAAAWGLGYGANVALKLAAADPRIIACAIWHGAQLPPTEELPRIAASLLLIFGEQDVAYPHPATTAMIRDLMQAGVRAENSMLLAPRDFSDPSYGAGYNAAAVANAWRATLNFLDRRLRN